MAENYWLGTVDGDPTDADNWSAAHVPAAGEDVRVPAEATVAIAGGDLSANAIGSYIEEDGCSIAIGTDGDPLILETAADGVVELRGSGTRYYYVSETARVEVLGRGSIELDGDANDLLVLDCAKITSLLIGPDRATPAEFDALVIQAAKTCTIRNLTTSLAAAVPIARMEVGTVYCESALTTVYQYGGLLYVRYLAGLTSWYGSRQARLIYQAEGSPIALLDVTGPAHADFSQDARAITVTQTRLRGSGAQLSDPHGRITHTNEIELIQSRLRDHVIDLGANREYQVTDI